MAHDCFEWFCFQWNSVVHHRISQIAEDGVPLVAPLDQRPQRQPAGSTITGHAPRPASSSAAPSANASATATTATAAASEQQFLQLRLPVVLLLLLFLLRRRHWRRGHQLERRQFQRLPAQLPAAATAVALRRSPTAATTTVVEQQQQHQPVLPLNRSGVNTRRLWKFTWRNGSGTDGVLCFRLGHTRKSFTGAP